MYSKAMIFLEMKQFLQFTHNSDDMEALAVGNQINLTSKDNKQKYK